MKKRIILVAIATIVLLSVVIPSFGDIVKIAILAVIIIGGLVGSHLQIKGVL
jgi:hypothetical protein